MAWRVQEADVTDVIRVADADSTISAATSRAVASSIDAANALTDKVSANDDTSELSDALLFQIEKYLACHFLEAFEQQYASKSTDGASASFQGQFGMRLDSTKHGQHAMLLDLTGYLAGLNRGRHKITAVWLGRPPSEQTKYEDRD